MAVLSDILRATQLFYSQALDLEWVSDPAKYTNAPGTYDPDNAEVAVNTGISVRSAVAAHVECRPNMQNHVRTFILTLDPATFVSGEDYEIDIESTKDGDFNLVGSGLSVESAAADLADAVNTAYGDPTEPAALVADLGTGRANSVIITQRSDPDGTAPDMVLATVSTSSTNTMAAYADAASCKLRVWAQRKRAGPGIPSALPMIWAIPGTQGGLLGSNSTSWVWGTVDAGYGVSLVRDVRSYDRLYAELYDVTALSGTFDSAVIFRPYLVVGISIPEE